jgi:hypothetical protein
VSDWTAYDEGWGFNLDYYLAELERMVVEAGGEL